MAHQVQDFEIHAGTDLVITVLVTDTGESDGTPQDLTGATEITWAAENAETDTRALTKSLGDGIALLTDSADEGKFTITLTDADTDDLLGWYKHEARVTDSAGLKTTVLTGMLEIHETILTSSE